MTAKKPRRGCLYGTVLLVLVGIGAVIGFPGYLRNQQQQSATKTAQVFANETVNARAQSTRVAELATETILALTPTDTVTPTPTSTRTPTPTSTPTSTPTIPPATQTAEMRQAYASATALDRQIAQTFAAQGKTSTAQVIAANRTGTAQFKSAQATQQAGYVRLDFREVRDKANDHLGDQVIVRGTINNLTKDQGFDAFFMFFSGTFDNCYVVLSNPLPDGIYKDSTVTVYGMVIGYITAKNGLGIEIEVPMLVDGYLLIDGVLQ